MTQVIKRLWHLLDRRERIRAAWVLFVFLIVAIVEVAGVASIMPFMAVLVNPEMIETNRYLSATFDVLGFSSIDAFVLFLGLVFFAALVMGLAAQAMGIWVLARFSQGRAYAWSARLVSDYLRQPYEWFLNRHSADFGTTVLAEVDIAVSNVLLPVMQLMAQVLVLLLIISLLLIVDPVLTLATAVAFSLAYGLLTAGFRRRIQRKGVERWEANHARFKLVGDSSGALKELKVRGLEELTSYRFRMAAKVMAQRQVSLEVLTRIPPLVMQGLFFGGMLLVLLYLVASAGGFQQAAPVAALFGLAGYRLLPAFHKIYTAFAKIRSGEASLDALWRLFGDLVSAAGLPAPPMASGQSRRSLQQSFSMKDIVYTFPGASQPSLNGITIEIPALSVVGLVGSTGSGKTTAVDVMLGLLRPQQGALFVDGVELGDLDIPSWQRAMGYVPQDIFLTDDTIAANIAFGVAHDDIDMLAVERAARAANLDQFVQQKLVHGYHTYVGERGVRLSGGQRQRVGIARALYHDPDILILDEATSALDNLTEQVVMEAVQNLGHQKTVVLIAHRLSTVKHCDRIFLLEEGRLSAQGSYAELFESNDHFRRMASTG